MLYVGSRVQMIHIWSSSCQWNPIISCLIKIQNDFTFLQSKLSQVILEKRALNSTKWVLLLPAKNSSSNLFFLTVDISPINCHFNHHCKCTKAVQANIRRDCVLSPPLLLILTNLWHIENCVSLFLSASIILKKKN